MGASEAGTTLAPDGAVIPPNGGAPGADAGPGSRPTGDAGGTPSTRDAAAPGDGASPQQPDAARADAAVDASTNPKPDAGSNPNDSGSTSPPDSGGGSGNPNFPPITNGCRGRTTRYWDCCKPHCGWTANVTGSPALATCNKSDGSWGSNFNEKSSCESGGAFMCGSNAPWAVSNTLAFGYAAVSARGDICGKCYQLQFSGELAGKTMVVQATNVGGDVGAGQFDLLIPGGGVGRFNACSTQWGVSSGDLGAQYGGFLATCKSQVGADQTALKNCVMQRCTSVFGAHGLTKLEAGCRWFVDWFQVADNPALVYKEVACPQELKSRGMNRNTSGGSACSI